ncbi:MAG: hypothetical protein UR39_C0002G0002 [Candidatus Woesebacteria bacterium GW2011_GWA1_33_30]|uniref:Uncharacterized protein n=1 Tax=Candidatus Woesebacteria bacterium GW2011_GWA2_33_28 TaxID=1618561 RepID=A0A0F9ZUG9_9BACT|nr:MAG: hypothetical protein UR38_C0002G0002 [Candidatus Woesebacteria bacterium GW2011_GWA2_33_28]KKP48712.1 MAG: hypothetical protein UR39_C0002G0002 [Candidatus Woesebacteria bacterium GW2011_GWA1_33_30]KKP49985.1 MAG: hypothetical protein UR40_C0002G0002 [Microgenomates group bacterium GW2011_GWC1_33_32]KKP51756.1 MAG: hypothetical protein UR44_C0006G0002 [Candidatus Woesebacteria bacterium GW2011_GWB1_33_38]
MTTFFRRDFLKLMGITAGSLVLTACGNSKEGDSGGFSGDELDIAWNIHALNVDNLRDAYLSNTNLEVVSFGPFDKSSQTYQYRAVILPRDRFDETSCYPASNKVFPSDAEKELRDKIREIYDGAEAVMVLQQQGLNGWEPMTLPTSVSQLKISVEISNYLVSLFGVENGKETPEVIEAKARMYGAFNPRSTTDEQANEIVDRLIEDPIRNIGVKEILPAVRSLWADIPENVPLDIAVNILRAGLSPVSGTDTFNEFHNVAVKSGYADAVFIPRATAYDEGVKALEKLKMELGRKPEVYFIERHTMYGLTSKVMVRHDPGDLEENRKKDGVFDLDGKYATSNSDMVKQWEEKGCFEVLDPNSLEYQDAVDFFRINTKSNLIRGEVQRILRVKKDMMSYFLVPNKFIGDSKVSGGFGMPVFMDNFDSEGKQLQVPEPKVMVFREMMRDKLGIQSIQPRDQVWSNWITEWTESANKLLDLGVHEISRIGACSPIEMLSRFLIGYHDVMRRNQFWMWSSSRGQAVLLDWFYGVLVDDKGSKLKETNLLTAVDDIEVYQLTADNYAGWIKKLAKMANNLFRKDILPEEDVVSVGSALEDDGTRMIIKKGEMVPTTRLINIGGDLFVTVGPIMKDENATNMALNEWGANPQSGFWNGVRNWGLNDSIKGVLAIRYEDALKKGLILDPDPNLLEAVKKIAATLIIAGSVVYWIAAPVSAGAVVTAGGLAVRTAIGRIFNFITR